MAMVLGAAHPLAARACSQSDVEVATVPAPFQFGKGVEQSQSILKAVPKRADVVIVGDSIGRVWPGDLAHEQFRTQQVANFSVSGATTQNVIWQIRKIGPSGLHPHLVVVTVGTNNLSRPDYPACAVEAGIKSVATEARRAWPSATVAVMGLFPRGEGFHFRDAERLEINKDLETWARSDKIRYFALNDMEITCGLYGNQSAQPHASDKISAVCKNYVGDLKHITRSGYEKVHAALNAAMRW